jgi:type II secretory pathway pseudopilin PulG
MTEQPQSPKKNNAKWWLIGGVVALVLVAFFLCIVVILIAILVPSFSAATNSADRSQAASTLRNAVAVVEQFATDNDGFYTTMTVDKLSAINADITWVDGDPGPGQVGFSNLGEANYTLTYKNSSGQTYTAEKKDTGEIVYRDSNGQSLP